MLLLQCAVSILQELLAMWRCNKSRALLERSWAAGSWLLEVLGGLCFSPGKKKK